MKVFKFYNIEEAQKFIDEHKFWVCNLKEKNNIYRVIVLDKDTKGSIELTKEEIEFYKIQFKDRLFSLPLLSKKIFSQTRKVNTEHDKRDRLTRIFKNPKDYKITRQEKALLDYYANLGYVAVEDYNFIVEKPRLEKKLIELGYNLSSIDYSSGKPYMIIYEKRLNNTSHIELHYIIHRKSWVLYFYIDTGGIISSYELAEINDTYKEKEKDLEELRKYE